MRKEREIKVCFVAPSIYSLFNNKCKVPFGGADVQLYLLSKEFSKKSNINVNVIAGDFHINKTKITYFDNIKVYISLPLENKKRVLLKYYIKLFLTLIKIAPDIVIQRGGGIETAICAFYCRYFDKKFIFSIATDDDVRKNRKIGIINHFYQYALNRMDFIVAQKQKQIKLLERWKQRKIPNITVIKTGYEIQEINNIKKKDILWVGRAVPLKQAEIFITLAKDFPDESFIMICITSFDKKYWEELRKKADEVCNLKFIQTVPFKEIDDYFYNSKVFINTSLPQEGFPNTYIQTLKNKTLVIALNVDPDNFLTNNHCGFNCKGDFNKMNDYLYQILTNKELFAQYSNNSYDYVKKNHNIKRVSKQWIEVIQNY